MAFPNTIATSQLNSASGHSYQQRKVVRTSGGTLYAIYQKQLAGQYQIYVKKSTDNGENWTDETRISTLASMDDYDHYRPAIAVDADDYLHVVWHGKSSDYTTTAQCWYSKYVAGWSDPVRISTYSGMNDQGTGADAPSIVVGSNGYLHVAWHGTATDYAIKTQIWYAKFTDSWATPVRISTYDGMDLQYQSAASITPDSNNHLHVVWQGKAEGYTSSPQIWYAKFTDSWATSVRISTYNGMDTWSETIPCIAVDGAGYLHVVWQGMAEGYTTVNQIWYAKFTDSWATPVRISTHATASDYDQYNANIAVDNNDYLHVIWDDYSGSENIWYATYTDSWATSVAKTASGRNREPNIRWARWFCNAGYLNRIWTEGTESPYNIRFDHDTSITMPTGEVPPPAVRGWMSK